MATLLTRAKARAVLDYTGRMLMMEAAQLQGRPLDLSGNPALSGRAQGLLRRCRWQRAKALALRMFRNCMTLRSGKRVPNRA